MNKSETIAALAKVMPMTQGNSDIYTEAKILKEFCPYIGRPGRQEETKPLHSRLLERVRLGAAECWHWCGARSAFGYGRMTYEGKTQAAHRLSYMAFVGEIPNGMSVLHKCDNPSCINPDHLWLGTYSDNKRDCLQKGRWKLKNPKKRFEHHSTVVTPDMLESIQKLRADGMSFKKIGEQVGIHTMTAWEWLNGSRKQ